MFGGGAGLIFITPLVNSGKAARLNLALLSGGEARPLSVSSPLTRASLPGLGEGMQRERGRLMSNTWTVSSQLASEGSPPQGLVAVLPCLAFAVAGRCRTTSRSVTGQGHLRPGCFNYLLPPSVHFLLKSPSPGPSVPDARNIEMYVHTTHRCVYAQPSHPSSLCSRVTLVLQDSSQRLQPLLGARPVGW